MHGPSFTVTSDRIYLYVELHNYALPTGHHVDPEFTSSIPSQFAGICQSRELRLLLMDNPTQHSPAIPVHQGQPHWHRLTIPALKYY